MSWIRVFRGVAALVVAIALPATGVANAQTAPTRETSAATPAAWGGCTLTVATPQRLTYYIHAWATLRCIENVTPGSIRIDLGYDTWYGGHSVDRRWYDVPANVNRSFGLLYACPGGTGGTLRTWSLDAQTWVSYIRNGTKFTATYAKRGPKATFRC